MEGPPTISEPNVLILMVRVGRGQEDRQIKEEASCWGHLLLTLEILAVSREGMGMVGGGAEQPLTCQVMFSDAPLRGTGWVGETKDFSALKYDFVMRAFKFNLDFHRDRRRATHRSLA